MPGIHPPVTLQLEPHAIPAVRVAFEEALVELGHQLIRLRLAGVIPGPWLGDPISADVVDYYHARVMDAPDGPYAALRAYEVELTKVRDNLQILEDHYRRTEGENAALWGRL
ncbi:transcriptional regulator [Pseudonocardia alaniniphila]|uniref:Transcriptional regulator n=1 Tax=Pseudonocardia alaniniphila TaxID=75291 RepID=A0ABS9TIX5_9PSEU|nr:transcriptional regulator [Pseudonocardia alaniniphila]MCH6168505.1 transcriptional regulator [Pseudonocardia alaniniphila]